MTGKEDGSKPATMAWFEIERNDAGRKVFCSQFKYCAKLNEEHIIITDGGLVWFQCSKAGAKTFFKVLGKVDPDIAQAIESNYNQSVYRDN